MYVCWGSLETSSDRSVVYDLTNQRGGPCVNPHQANNLFDGQQQSATHIRQRILLESYIYRNAKRVSREERVQVVSMITLE